MSKFNILLLGGARRIALAKNFKKILEKKNKVKLFSYEIDKNNCFGSVGKVILGKKWIDKNIFKNLLYNIKKNKIDLVVPCTDPATIVCSKLSEKYRNLGIFTSSSSAVNICFDKDKLQKYLEKKNNKINLIPYEKNKFPIFAKPKKGSASIGIYKIRNKREMRLILSSINSKKYIFQKFIKGTEYTVDTYINKSNKIEGIVTRERARILHGESVFIKTMQINQINTQVQKILKAFDGHLKGPLCFQFMKWRGKYFLLEINPRVSGGINASILSGLKVPLYMRKDCFNLKIKYKYTFKRIKMVKYFEEKKI